VVYGGPTYSIYIRCAGVWSTVDTRCAFWLRTANGPESSPYWFLSLRLIERKLSPEAWRAVDGDGVR